jgi:rhodanese-related sulfurtransferase
VINGKLDNPFTNKKKTKEQQTAMKKTGYFRYVFIIMFVTGVLGYLILNSWSLIRTSYKNITVDQLAQMMSRKDFILINVHIPYEGEITQTDFLIPFNAIGSFKKILSNDQDAKIVLYCKVGQMSRIVAEQLSTMGYAQVHNLQDGMRAWSRDGRQII